MHTVSWRANPLLFAREEVIIFLDVRSSRRLYFRVRIDPMSEPDAIIGHRLPRHLFPPIRARFRPGPHFVQKACQSLAVK